MLKAKSMLGKKDYKLGILMNSLDQILNRYYLKT